MTKKIRKQKAAQRKVSVRAIMEGKEFQLFCFTDFKMRAGQVLRVTKPDLVVAQMLGGKATEQELKLEILEFDLKAAEKGHKEQGVKSKAEMDEVKHSRILQCAKCRIDHAVDLDTEPGYYDCGNINCSGKYRVPGIIPTGNVN